MEDQETQKILFKCNPTDNISISVYFFF